MVEFIELLRQLESDITHAKLQSPLNGGNFSIKREIKPGVTWEVACWSTEDDFGNDLFTIEYTLETGGRERRTAESPLEFLSLIWERYYKEAE